jgi:hypothetical protein
VPVLKGIAANREHKKTYAVAPVRRDPNGVMHLGVDGVLRSLNADRTIVLDYRRLSPEEIKDLASPFDRATQESLVGVDGRDVDDVEQLWAVPNVDTVMTDTSDNTPVKRAASLFKRARCADYSCNISSQCPKGGSGDPNCPDCITSFSPGSHNYCANI